MDSQHEASITSNTSDTSSDTSSDPSTHNLAFEGTFRSIEGIVYSRIEIADPQTTCVFIGSIDTMLQLVSYDITILIDDLVDIWNCEEFVAEVEVDYLNLWWANGTVHLHGPLVSPPPGVTWPVVLQLRGTGRWWVNIERHSE